MDLVFKNIKKLCQIRTTDITMVKGADMATLPSLDNAYIYIREGRIHSFGSMNTYPADIPESSTVRIIDAQNKYLLPAFCDSHTHLVFAAWRETEFVDKIQGLTYEQIAQKGGGILNSARRLQNTSEQELYESALVRIEEIKKFGTGAVEIKSGYGLNTESELKMLRVIKRLKETTSLTIKSTFLGAHTYPDAFRNNHEGYIRELIDYMLPAINNEQLADYIDVFCDRGFFSVDETAKILEAASKYGLQPKIHANELDFSGGVQVGVRYQARSVDHLECIGDDEMETLLHSNTMPTLLPSTAFFLGLHYPPARNMIQRGLPIALASDYNPGTSPGGRMSFILSLACIQMKMTPEEALNAATLNSAYAMGVEHELGSISIGKKANLILTKPLDNLSFIPYRYANDFIDEVFI
jgi:imidazolonepropionase